jgi:hypothetical protein
MMPVCENEEPNNNGVSLPTTEQQQRAHSSMISSQSRSSFNFTEAVPLSLSSLAHMSVPLDEGVMDGIREIVHHMQLACVNYARATTAVQYSLKELWVDDWQWTTSAASDLPLALAKLGMKHKHCQRVNICVGQPPDGKPTPTPHSNSTLTAAATVTVNESEHWLDDPLVLGTLSFWYSSQELFTEEELQAENYDDLETEMNDDDDIPNCILYKVSVEYRSLPPTSNKVAVEAEELSMLSFGGSVDDAVKYGALASLHDENAKYVMEICSVRGKKYKFDLMDSTLSDGRLPRWRAREGSEPPFVKSLCVTVTEHNNDDNVARLSLVLDGNLRKPKECHPKLHFYTKKLVSSFLIFRKPVSVTAVPSQQSLLLDADLAGQVFIDGRYVTTWGRDCKIGTHVEALFGLDLNSIPVWHGRIVDYNVMIQMYSLLWQDLLVDSRLMGLDLANMLLSRLMYGKDETEVYDDDEDKVDTSQETLESQIFSSSKYDPVGICPKALATRFAAEFGKLAIPVLEDEVHVVRRLLAHRTPVVVPARLISVLKRGGYFELGTVDSWFTDGIVVVRQPHGDHETKLIDEAVHLLMEVGVDDVTTNQVVFAKIDDPNPERHFNMCRYYEVEQQYYLNECLATSTAFWVAHSIAREHPSGGMMERKLLEKMIIK